MGLGNLPPTLYPLECFRVSAFCSKALGRKAAVGSQFLHQVNRSLGAYKKTVLENPVCIMSSLYRKPDQVIQPWQFGHGETKATCLWLKGLPLLIPSNIVTGRVDRIHKMPPSPDRWKERSRTYSGIADAMAIQWGREAANTEPFLKERKA